MEGIKRSELNHHSAGTVYGHENRYGLVTLFNFNTAWFMSDLMHICLPKGIVNLLCGAEHVIPTIPLLLRQPSTLLIYSFC